MGGLRHAGADRGVRSRRGSGRVGRCGKRRSRWLAGRGRPAPVRGLPLVLPASVSRREDYGSNGGSRVGCEPSAPLTAKTLNARDLSSGPHGPIEAPAQAACTPGPRHARRTGGLHVPASPQRRGACPAFAPRPSCHWPRNACRRSAVARSAYRRRAGDFRRTISSKEGSGLMNGASSFPASSVVVTSAGSILVTSARSGSGSQTSSPTSRPRSS